MTATEYEQQAHRTIAGHAAENIPYLGFGLMAEAGEVADKIAKAVRRGEIEINTTRFSLSAGTVSNSGTTSWTNSETCFGSLQCWRAASALVSKRLCAAISTNSPTDKTAA